MAFNLTFEDSSPLISYAPSGAWTDNPDDDSLIQSYSGSSLHTTSAQGATATINFNGTGIWLFGGTRPSYGTYTISVDGRTTKNGNANTGDPAFKQLLGGASGLTNGPHTVVFTNTGSGSAVDLDSFIFQGQAGLGELVSSTTIDDTDSRITYAPSSSDWQIDVQPGLYVNDTSHVTQTRGASATIPFSGNSVAVYGTVSPDHANILVSLDGQTSSVQGGAGGFARVVHTKTLLYYADNLGSQQHQLVFSSDQSSGTGQLIDIDAVTVYSSSNSNINSTARINNASSPSASNSSSHVNRAHLLPAIIGGVVGAVILLLLIAMFFFFLHCRRQRRRRSFINPPHTPALPVQQTDIMEAGLGRHSNHFLEVEISPGGGLPTGPPRVMTLPFERSASTRSYYTPAKFTPSVIPESIPKLALLAPPPPTVPSLIPSATAQNPGSELVLGERAPLRPTRPPNLLLPPRMFKSTGK